MSAYLDNAATTMVCPEAADAVLRTMTESFGNPSSTHKAGRDAMAVLERARKNVADALGARPPEIFFTSGGTESDNWALLAGALAGRHKGRHIVTTAGEHDAVANSVKELARLGFEVDYVNLLGDGRPAVSDFERLIRDDTVMVSLMAVNNETGAVFPVREVADIIKKKRSPALLHTDAVQAFLKVPVSPKSTGADLISISAHKIHGPKGAGALYVKEGIRLPPFLFGGGQENGRRPGTEALPAIAGFGEAAMAGAEAFVQNCAAVRRLYDYVNLSIASAIPEAVILSEGDSPYILSVSLPGYRSEVIMNYLDAKGICVSKSSACGKGRRSRVLEAMGLPPAVIDGAIRVSFSRFTTTEEADLFVKALAEAKDGLLKKTERR